MKPSPSRSFFRQRSAAWAAGAFVLAGLFAGLQAGQDQSGNLTLKQDPKPVTRGPLERASFSDIVKEVSPSVVKITSQISAKQARAELGGMDDPILRQFFGNRMPEIQSPPQTGVGSGVIISADGYIATNNHVVDGADHLTVALADGRELSAKVIGRDPLTDLAVVKVEATNLPAVTFADSTKIEVGDRVLAIGNPFGIGETVTSGIVSATGRRVGILNDVKGIENFIQTDAAINPGNSGGALVDVDGRLVGLNTAILSRSGGFQGVGLAVPSALVSQVAESLVRTGKVVRGFLGVNVQNLTPALADSFELKDHRGALVADVTPGSPAAKAGLEAGDVIVGVNGSAVKDANAITLAVGAVAPGKKVSLDVIRDGKKQTVVATAGERPDGRGKRSSNVAANDEGVLNGVGVDDLDPQVRRQMNVPERVEGAIITSVDPGSAAARAGLSPGDVILELNHQPVTSADEAVELSAKAENKKTLVKLWSHGSTIFVVVDETGSSKGVS